MAVTNRVVAPRYAKALFEAAQDANVLPAVHEEFNQLQTVLDENPTVLAALDGGRLNAAQKEALLTSLTTGANPLIVRLVTILAGNHRISGLPDVITAFNARYNQALGVVAATVTTAIALDDTQTAALEQALAKRLGAQSVTVQNVVDERVLGGVKVVANDQIIDGTVATRLTKLQAQLLTN